MTSLYDGLAGLLNATFGGPVTWLPEDGGAETIHSVFREIPVEVIDADNHAVLDVAPVWRVPKPVGERVSSGDRIELADGRMFRVVARRRNGSPALDAFISFDMERV